MWADIVSQATQEEPALLRKNPDALLAQREDGLTALRFHDGHPIAHATLWHLADGWYELGTVWVARSHRGHDLSAELYRDLFRDHPERNILATTTNPASLRIGIRVGMRCVPFRALPASVWRETCCCPFAKTGSDDNVSACRQRESRCFVRVTEQTWWRLGQPAEIDFCALL
ncbi:hypothetical protein A2348_01925 [Candidatus Uhrbacteria bacterium RIFOXYB12_FULL_58_10]|uniref:N-acetyltransferase domain-containing protein n=1 Tax=Candidatus Uhrbacteria bacterium RIFOXYB2_FULL_57_15 TaxID=1802422 RepID=A0A1F7WB81_9BACT|nr:MAG: hypothetical protein A2348_01925 [Candidatus Uhrbacteria bacterium RIFOXYB12_FULL_58_10]OGL99354.1 MAG: hypothetical protein A2304_00045 [Candidatus Uhrbacteria bacterium RIFOXYB2_FULL_57_15]OGM00485.1 MAG: hypothetical protein A2501_00795 [Candidatus Uhrbacteria bacterium RIFOXYC12_FULL_57_11]